MPITVYKLWASAARPRDEGQLVDRQDVGVHALAKRSLVNDFELANEVLALRLAKSLFLPVPDGTVVDGPNGRYFCSMVFGGSGQRLPPADLQKLATSKPELSCAITVFDSWICNRDRNETNMSFNEETDEVMLIDQGSALFGTKFTSFRQYAEMICLDNNDLAAELRTFLGFDEAIERILAIPDWFIREAVHDVASLGIADKDIAEMRDFLLVRRKRLRRMFYLAQSDRKIFRNIPHSQMFPILDEGHDYIDYYI